MKPQHENKPEIYQLHLIVLFAQSIKFTGFIFPVVFTALLT